MTSFTMWLPLSNRLFRNCYAVKQRILRWNKVNQATARRHAAESQLTKKGAKSTEIQPSPTLQPIATAIFHLCGKRSGNPNYPTRLKWNAQSNHSSTATLIKVGPTTHKQHKRPPIKQLKGRLIQIASIAHANKGGTTSYRLMTQIADWPLNGRQMTTLNEIRSMWS